MKKRLLTALLVFVLVCATVVGCSEQGNNTNETLADVTTDIPTTPEDPEISGTEKPNVMYIVNN